MPTNHYFNNFEPSVTSEQHLMEDTIQELIQIMGHDVYYLPREVYGNPDVIFGEKPDSKFDRAYMIDVYIETVDGFQGPQEYFSKFGHEIRDNAVFVVARKTFERFIPANVATRPRESDLIYVPLMKALFEIKFVEEEQEFFSLGKRYPYSYYLSVERYRSSNENINTGIEEVDNLESKTSYTIELTLGAGANNYLIGEQVFQGSNLTVSTASGEVTEWDNANNKLYIINIKGVFADNTTVRGANSNTAYTMTSYNDLGDFVYNEEFDNETFQVEGDEVIIDNDETNPFGAP